MDIGYGKGFVWGTSILPHIIVRVVTLDGCKVTYLAKTKGEEEFVQYVSSCEDFYSIFSKDTDEDECNKDILDKATSKSGIVVTVGDLWFTNDTKDMCEVVSIYEENSVVLVESYSEKGDTLDSDPIDQFVSAYNTVSEWMYTDTVDFEDTELNFDILQNEAYDEGYAQGLADSKSCDKQKGIAISTFEGAYKVWSETEYLQRSGVNKERLGKERKHSHYFKDVKHFDVMDTYLFCRVWGIDDKSGCMQHSIKKLIDAGKRGAGKSKIKDITEARDTLNRYLEIEEMMVQIEDKGNEKS